MPKRRDDRPHLDHEVLTQKQQAKFLGVKEETVMNLGHPVPVSKLAENPLGRPINYDSAPTQRIYRDPPKLQGVYRKCSDPVSGIASEQTLDKWADYAAKDSYRTGPGPGVEPPASDARRRSVQI